jgi:hypothetical protein
MCRSKTKFNVKLYDRCTTQPTSTAKTTHLSAHLLDTFSACPFFGQAVDKVSTPGELSTISHHNINYPDFKGWPPIRLPFATPTPTPPPPPTHPLREMWSHVDTMNTLPAQDLLLATSTTASVKHGIMLTQWMQCQTQPKICCWRRLPQPPWNVESIMLTQWMKPQPKIICCWRRLPQPLWKVESFWHSECNPYSPR